MGRANPLRFCTKFQDDETDLVYYGCRYLNTSTGRWLSRDPITERRGANLYGFVHGDPTDLFDSDGREPMQSGAQVNADGSRGDTRKKPALFTVSIHCHHYYSDVIISYASAWNGGEPECKDIVFYQTTQLIREGLLDAATHLYNEDWRLDDGGGKPDQRPQCASNVMYDAPGGRWWSTFDTGFDLYGITQNVETCAYCADKGRERWLGCVSWGHSVGGCRRCSSWGSGNPPPVPPSDTFLKLVNGNRAIALAEVPGPDRPSTPRCGRLCPGPARA